MDETGARAALNHYLEHSAAGEEEVAHEIYHPEAVLEFPQSGERFEGVPNFLEWRRSYPATKIDFDVRGVRGGGDVWTAEMRVRYEDGPWMYGVKIAESRGDKVARETIYVMDGGDRPGGRARWWARPPHPPREG